MLENLRLLRTKLNISQAKLGDAVGLTQQSINQYENHSVEPDIGTLIRLADFFGTSVDFLVGHTDIRRPVENTQPYDLNAREGMLITRYRLLTESQKSCVDTVAETLLDSSGMDARR